jgi:hypothetical protein
MLVIFATPAASSFVYTEFHESRLELAFQLVVGGHKAAREAIGALVHLASPWPDAAGRQAVQ